MGDLIFKDILTTKKQDELLNKKIDLESNSTNDIKIIKIWLSRNKNSPHTFRSYKKELERLLLWLEHERFKSLKEISLEDIQQYISFLKNPQPISIWIGPRVSRKNPQWKPFEKPLSESSTNQSIIIIRCCFEFLLNIDYITHNPFRLVKRREIISYVTNSKAKIERFIPLNTWKILWQKLHELPQNNEKDKFYYQRNVFLFTILYLQAPRVSEIANALMKDIYQLRGNWWWLIYGKGGKVEKVPLNNKTLKALQQYRKFMNLKPLPNTEDHSPLIKQRNGKSLTKGMIYKIVKNVISCIIARLDNNKCKEDIKLLKKVSTHWFRHTSITHQADAGIDIQYLQAMARHSSIETTQRYLHNEDDKWHSIIQNHKL